MTTQKQEISRALVLSESQFPPTYVKDSQPPMEQMPLDSEVFEVPPMVPPFVLAEPNVVSHAAAQKATIKRRRMGKWYVVFEGRVPRVSSSWEACNKQVSGYCNNNHGGGFQTRQAEEDAYSKYVQEQSCSKVAVGKVDRPLGLKNFIISIQFIIIAVLWHWCAKWECV
ncbi:Protein MOR1 [Hordeum vulgare]|nr:Protein MOR1 [Hordeum vulgare]